MLEPSPFARADRHAGGFTLVEATIATLLVVVLVGLSLGAISFMQSATSYSNAKLRQESSYRLAMRALRTELEQTTLEPTPELSGYRHRYVLESATGSPSIRYQKLEGLHLVGDALELLWSPLIKLSANSRGQLVREHPIEGRDVIASGIQSLMFARRDHENCFRVTFVTQVPDPRTGQVRDYTENMIVRPRN